MKYLPGLSYSYSGGPRSIADKNREWFSAPTKETMSTKNKPNTKKEPATFKLVDGKKYMTDQQFADTDKTFRELCRLAGIPATARQAKKFRGMGSKPPYNKPHGAAYAMLTKVRWAEELR